MADEKFYTVPLGEAFEYVRTKRVRRAVKLMREFVARHGKVPAGDVRLSEALNMLLWARGIQKPPRKVKVKIVKEAGIAKAYLHDEKIAKPEAKKEQKAEAKTEVKGETKPETAAKPEAKAAVKPPATPSAPAAKEAKGVKPAPAAKAEPAPKEKGEQKK